VKRFPKDRAVHTLLRIETIRSSGPASLKETGKELARIQVTFNEAGPEDLIVRVGKKITHHAHTAMHIPGGIFGDVSPGGHDYFI
jgi:hypothetical protein